MGHGAVSSVIVFFVNYDLKWIVEGAPEKQISVRRQSYRSSALVAEFLSFKNGSFFIVYCIFFLEPPPPKLGTDRPARAPRQMQFSREIESLII